MIRRLLRHFSEQFGRMLVIPNPPAPPLPPVKVRVDMPPVKPCKVTSIEPWPDPPEVSCLVRGIVKSLDEESDAWSWNCCGNLESWSHGKGLRVRTWGDDQPLTTSSGYTLNAEEGRLVLQSMNARKQRVRDERDRMERERHVNSARYFEDLGCPTPTS